MTVAGATGGITATTQMTSDVEDGATTTMMIATTGDVMSPEERRSRRASTGGTRAFAACRDRGDGKRGERAIKQAAAARRRANDRDMGNPPPAVLNPVMMAPARVIQPSLPPRNKGPLLPLRRPRVERNNRPAAIGARSSPHQRGDHCRLGGGGIAANTRGGRRGGGARQTNRTALRNSFTAGRSSAAHDSSGIGGK